MILVLEVACDPDDSTPIRQKLADVIMDYNRDRKRQLLWEFRSEAPQRLDAQDAAERFRLIAERNADGRHPIG